MKTESAITGLMPHATMHGDPQYLTNRLEITLDNVLKPYGGFGTMAPIGGIRPHVADDAGKLLVHSRAGYPIAVLKCSSPIAPQAVADATRMELRVREALGPDLGRVVLEPLATGDVDGCTYTLLPYRQPLSTILNLRRIQRRLQAPVIYRWLRGVVQATARDVSAESTQFRFVDILRHQSEHADWLDAAGRAAAQRAVERLTSGVWRPKFVLSHNDLHEGNILLGAFIPWTASRLVIIDWGGCHVDGYAMYDLIRLALSLRTSAHGLRREIAAHCALLGCSIEDGGAYLLSSLGHIEHHLNHFPRAEFVKTAQSCWEKYVDTTRVR